MAAKKAAPKKAPKKRKSRATPRKPRGRRTDVEVAIRRDYVESALCRGLRPRQIWHSLADHKTIEQPGYRCIEEDVAFVRKRWVDESTGETREQRMSKLEALIMESFRTARSMKRLVTRKTTTDDGIFVRTVEVSSPDHQGMAKAIDQMAALYGLNAPKQMEGKIDGNIGLGLSDLAALVEE